MPNVMKMENAGLIAGSTTLPVILVTVDNMDFPTWGDFYDFVETQVAPSLGGAITTYTFFYNQYQNPGLFNAAADTLSVGAVNYGDSSGFQFTRFVGKSYGDHVNEVGFGSTGVGFITYKGNNVYYSGIFSGTAPEGYPIRMNPLILFINENDQIFYGWQAAQNAISFWSGGFGGMGVADDCLPYAEFPRQVNQWYRQQSNNTPFTALTAGDAITDDIGNRIPVGQDDPYAPGGYSGGDTSVGDYDLTGEPQPLGPVPSWVKDGLDTGFYTLFNPTSSELRQLASYLWSNNFDLDLLKKLFNNPMDLILNFGVVPCAIESGGSKEVGIGLISTGIYMNTAAERNVHLEFGPEDVTKAFSAYLDYSPYTRIDLILPFVGVVPLDVDAIMGRALTVVYNIDILTGCCVAGLMAGGHAIGEYAGNCMRPLPLTGADYTNMLSGLIQTAGAIAAGAASGGAAGAVAGGMGAASSAIVNEGKPMIQKGGALSSASGWLGHLKPTLICSIPRQCLPSAQQKLEGYPSFVSGKISSLFGFARVEKIQLHTIPATAEELEELEAILKDGFIYNKADKKTLPTPPEPPGMAVLFGYNKSMKERVYKNVDWENRGYRTGSLVESTSITDPVILIQGGKSLFTGVNYFYVPDFGRFYYIRKIETIRTGVVRISGHVDVLYSFADDLKDNSAIFSSMQQAGTLFGFNKYLNDGTFRVYQDRVVINKYEFTAGFSHSEYVLAMAGS